jgi:hypothetical protein
MPTYRMSFRTPIQRAIWSIAFIAAGLPSVPVSAVTSCTAGNPNASLAQSTPTAAFANNGDGTVTHSLTGLTWKRCAQGQSGAACATGAAATLTWSAALAAAVADTTGGFTDWRLPNMKELDSIVELCGWGPAINQEVFPATPISKFHSGTTDTNSGGFDWVTDFNTGGVVFDFKSDTVYVRLVRGAALDATDAQNTPPAPPILDVDASVTATKYDALTDGLIVIRYMFGLTGAPMISGALGGTATRSDPAAIKTYLDGNNGVLDIDGNGTTDAPTDGLLILRFLFGLRGASLVAGAIGPSATRVSATDVEAYLQLLMP